MRKRDFLLLRAIRLTVKVLPRQLRIKAGLNLFYIFLNSLLELVGIAVLVPLLIVILDEKKITTNLWLQKIYTFLEFQSNTTFIIFLCLLVLIFTVIKNIVSVFLLKLQYRFSFSVYTHVSSRLLDYYYSLGLGKLKEQNSNRIVNYLTSVTILFSQNVINSVSGIINEALILILFIAALLLFDPVAILILIVLIVPCILIFLRIVKKRMQSIGEERNLINISQNRLLYEAFHGYVDIEMKNKGGWVFRRFDMLLNQMKTVQIRNALYMQLPLKFIEVVIVMSMLVVIGVGILTGQSVSDIGLLLGVFVVAAYRLLPSINRILNFFLNLRNHEYTFDIIEKSEGDRNISRLTVEGVKNTNFEGEIRLENIGFHFNGTKRVLYDVNLTIKKGEIIGIIGKSGSGKSTLLNLLLRFYKETAGSIKVDGRDLQEIDLTCWRSLIGYVPQDVFVFDGSLKKNIALGVENADVDNVMLSKVIGLAELTDFVDQLEQREDTILGERGGKMSGGQRQRVGIARALYGGAEILILDEATSSLDTDTEKEITDAIYRLHQANSSLTIIIISHKYSSLQYCERIIELKSGTISSELTYSALKDRVPYRD